MNENFQASHRRNQFLIFTIYFFACILLKAETSFYADDNYRWAFSILTQSDSIINSHHLIFNVLSLIYQPLNKIADISPVTFLSFYSSVMGAIGLIWLYQLAIKLNYKNFALAAVLLCGGTSGYLSYSVVGDVYTPTIACIIGGLLFLLRTIDAEIQKERLCSMLYSALLFVAAILHHQAFFVLIASFSLYAFFAKTNKPNLKMAIPGLATIALSGALSLIVYLGIFISTNQKQDSNFYEFTAGYAESFASYPDMKKIDASTIINSAAGFSRALVSTNIIFTTQKAQDFIKQRFPYRHTHSTVYLANQINPVSKIIAGISLGLFLALAIPISLYGVLRSGKNRLLLLMIISIIPQMLFFLWWESISDEFWIWTLPFWSLIAAYGLSQIYKKAQNYVLHLTWIPLLLSTLILASFPYSKEESDLDWENYKFSETLSPNDILISSDEIVVANRIQLLQHSKQFEYFNIFTRAEKGKPIDYQAMLSAAETAVNQNKNVFIGPYIQTPPQSYLKLIEVHNPGFKDDLIEFINALKEIEGVTFISLNKELKGYYSKPLSP